MTHLCKLYNLIDNNWHGVVCGVCYLSQTLVDVSGKSVDSPGTKKMNNHRPERGKNSNLI